MKQLAFVVNLGLQGETGNKKTTLRGGFFIAIFTRRR